MSESHAEDVVSFRQEGEAVGDVLRRPARLFVAGHYPDKGVTITVEHLDQVVTRFAAGGSRAPVQVEHIETAIDPLGHVVALYRQDDTLYGLLEFGAGIAAHLADRKAERLSVAFLTFSESEGGGYGLKEVSVVIAPRVSAAALLPLDAVTAKLAEFKAAGKITPAMEPHAAALLASSAVVTFTDGTSIPVQTEVLALLSALPVVQPRTSAAAAVPTTAPASGLVPVEFKAPAQAGAPAPLAPEVARMVAGLGGDPAKIAATLAGKVGR